MKCYKLRSDLKILFDEAVKSVNPKKLIEDTIKMTTVDGQDYMVIDGKYYNLLLDIFVVGFGKAALGMARAVEHLIQPYLRRGIVSVPVGTLNVCFQSSTQITTHLEVYECAKNNLPDKEAKETTTKIAELVEGLDDKSLLLVLISGGGSALLSLPVKNISIEEKAHMIVCLANAGATIEDVNCVRRKISRVKGGRLALMASPARVVSFIISDAVGDHLSTIASGPTCPSFDPPELAWDTIRKYNLQSDVPDRVLQVLQSTEKKQTASDFEHVENIIIGNNAIALKAASDKAQGMGYISIVLSDKIEGNVRDVSSAYVHLLQNVCRLLLSQVTHETFIEEMELLKKLLKLDVESHELAQAITSSKSTKKPVCLVLGGETTVKVFGKGLGGRNQELALRFAVDLNRARETDSALQKFDVMFMSAGTDGIDGPTDAAGAICDADTVNQANMQGVDPCMYLNNNDSYNFFSSVNSANDLIKTGHTGTNVMDVHILIINSRFCQCKQNKTMN